MQPKQLEHGQSCTNEVTKLESLLEEGWWTAHAVVLSQEHPVTDAVPVIQDAEMAQTRGFGHAGCAGGELDIDDVVGI